MSDAKVKFFDRAGNADGEEYYFTFVEPGGKRSGLLPITLDKNAKRGWLWNKNTVKPTFTPSINWHDVWHGFVVNGKCCKDQEGLKEE